MPELIPGHVQRALEQALRRSTRGLIFTELLLTEELSPSMLAERLGLDLNVVAYHMRRLAAMGLIAPTRRVPYRGGVSQRFYRVTPGLSLSLQARPQALAALAPRATPEEQHDTHFAYLLLAANLLARAPAHYRGFDSQQFDSLLQHQHLFTVALGALPRSALVELARLVSNYLDQQWRDALPEGPQQAHRDFLVFAALPDFLTSEAQT